MTGSKDLTDPKRAMEAARAGNQPSLPSGLNWLSDCGMLNVIDQKTGLMREDSRAAAQNHLTILEAYLKPADLSWISARVTLLLAHWPERTTSVEVMETIIMDWVRVLQDLPQHAIDQACERYLAQNKFRPAPSEIRQLGWEIIGAKWTEAQKLRIMLGLVDPRTDSPK